MTLDYYLFDTNLVNIAIGKLDSTKILVSVSISALNYQLSIQLKQLSANSSDRYH